MVGAKYEVRLRAEQQGQWEHLVRASKGTAPVVTRARILLNNDQGWLAPEVDQVRHVVESTVCRIK